MSKESKQDRIARNIFEQVSEHFHDLKALEANPVSKELDVERWSQSFLKNCLGYTATNGYTIRAQETKGKARPDLIVLKNDKPVFVVEVKKLGFDLNKSDFRSGKVQLNEYLNLIGNVKWGMLTNGQEWKLFDFSQGNFNGVEVCSFDIRSEDDTIDTSKKNVEDMCYEIVDFHEHSFSAEYWDECLKEALAFSPDTLAKAILSVDVVKYISKFVKGEHEYKASHDVLTDKVYDLLRLGLNDAIKGWNEAKAMDFEKYIKSQKRASNRNKKSRSQKNTSDLIVAAAPTVGTASEGSVGDDKKVG